ncbi:replication factor C large subunit [Candidatus Woesearchaeota archaeon]|nr:replication factor C large subunit [Candidatus Woesearchaeota archaeon]
MVPWTYKYKPLSLKEVVGQDAALAQLQKFVSSKPFGKAAVLYGPSGSGKTSSVHALANDLSYEIIEVNASDVRNKEQIDLILGNAVKQRSLFSKGKIILVDEIDGISGTEDRGGVSALVSIISSSSFPIICTAEDPFDKKFSDLRKQSTLIEYQPLPIPEVKCILDSISKKEKLVVSPEVIQELSRRCGGDARAAVTDLHTASLDAGQLSTTALDMLGEREQKKSIIDALLLVLKTTKPELAIPVFDTVDEDLDMIFLWLDENLPLEYTKALDLARAYEMLSQADIMRRRIRRWQHWRFLVYINAYLSGGVAVAKDQKYTSFVSYKPTTRLLKLWQANMKYQKRKAIAEKIAAKTHTSHRRVIQDIIPYLQAMVQADQNLAKKITDDFGLESEEIEWLKKK